ncbi:hypothetical protein [Methylococcus sp. Mc7]|uniref:hypothetical protein n=1 Tax=Methylococcus sp. Mc7 TaxID=2860258 RepID=UPI001C527DE7|nr:hypothetical protein [Methylococcus sp. Mc7]QXP83527.1 hypothetical protein KW115_15365 [Methylococcus sp. Mc7]
MSRQSVSVDPGPDLGALTAERLLRGGIGALAGRWRNGAIGDAQYAAGYFLIWQIALHGARFTSRKSRLDPRPSAEGWLDLLDRLEGDVLTSALCGRLERYQFRCVIPAVPAALVAWLQGRWALRLTERIPSPREVLAMQGRGERPVTLLAVYPRMLEPVLSKPNGFEFFVHDLEHACKFFQDSSRHAGQRAFFLAMAAALDAGCFEGRLTDPVFSARFDYLVSDMNTHVVHSLQYLRAILIESELRLEGKAPNQRLSAGGRDAIAALLAALGACWGFGPRARKALLDGCPSGADASAIGLALAEFARTAAPKIQTDFPSKGMQT